MLRYFNGLPKNLKGEAMKTGCRKNGDIGLSDSFECRSRRMVVSLDKCLSDFVDADVYQRRRRACFRCPEGRRNREVFAGKFIGE